MSLKGMATTWWKNRRNKEDLKAGPCQEGDQPIHAKPRTGKHITSGLKMYRKQRDSIQQFGDLFHMTFLIMAAPLKDFSSMSWISDRSDIELGEFHEFCMQTFTNGL